MFAHRTVGEVVAEDYRRGAVFKRFGIDFCCGGGTTVQAACATKHVDYTELERALIAAAASRAAALPDPSAWELGFLADFIVNVHHTYVRDTLPILLPFSHKVARVHGGGRPELVEIAQRVEALAIEMDQHMRKEEQILFPYIKTLEAARKGGTPAAPAPFGTVRNPIQMMKHEHDHAGGLMRQIRMLSSDYTPPESACNTYRAMFAKLEEFEADLHRHVHLENNVLFPRAVTLEEELVG